MPPVENKVCDNVHMKKSPAAAGLLNTIVMRVSAADLCYVGRLWSFLTLYHFELDFIALRE